MKEESIKQAREIIITSLNISKIEELDKVELMMNIRHFLDNYDEMIKVRVKKRGNRCSG